MYAVPVWASVLHILSSTHKLSAVHRNTYSVKGLFCLDVVFVLSGMVPINISEDKMTNIYNIKSIPPLSETKKRRTGELYN